jgi:ATP-dependent helicase HrpA
MAAFLGGPGKGPPQHPSRAARGLLGNIGIRDEGGMRRGVHRGPRHQVLGPPGLRARKAGKWLVAAELVETTRLFARCVAGIDPKWLEDIGAHLIRRERQNPHWEKSRGQVIASSAARFTGCRCISTGGCTFGPLDPKLARDIFIQSALVEGALETRAPFLAHNRRLWPKSSVSSTSRAARTSWSTTS